MLNILIFYGILLILLLMNLLLLIQILIRIKEYKINNENGITNSIQENTIKNIEPKEPCVMECIEGAKADFELLNGCLIVRLIDEIEHHSSAPIREQSDKLISTQKVKYVIFDFNGLDYIDSSAIGIIMGRYYKILFTGGKIAVTGVNQLADRIFRQYDLYKIIYKFETIEEAVNAFSK